MLEIAIGIAAILLGAKAFTKQGLPLTNTKRLIGARAKATGGGCIALGLLLCVIGLFTIDDQFGSAIRFLQPKPPAANVAPVTPPVEVGHLMEYRSPFDHFSVLLPTMPTVKTDSRTENRQYVVDQGSQAFIITYVNREEPTDENESTLDDLEAEVRNSPGFKVRSVADRDVSGHPAREILFDDEAGSPVRMLIVSGMDFVAQLNVAVAKGHEESDAVNKIFASFQFHPAPEPERESGSE